MRPLWKRCKQTIYSAKPDGLISKWTALGRLVAQLHYHEHPRIMQGEGSVPPACEDAMLSASSLKIAEEDSTTIQEQNT